MIESNPAAVISTEPKRILVADDEDSLREVNICLLSSIMKRKGIDPIIEEAVNGLETVGKLNAADYNLVLLDFQMPHMNGAQVMGAVPHYATRTLLGSGYDTEKIRMELERTLPNHPHPRLLPKPFNIRRLEFHVISILGRAQAGLALDILMADSDKNVRDYGEDLTRQAIANYDPNVSCRFEYAGDKEEALRKLGEKRFALVVTDPLAINMGGIEFFRSMPESYQGRTVFFTGKPAELESILNSQPASYRPPVVFRINQNSAFNRAIADALENHYAMSEPAGRNA